MTKARAWQAYCSDHCRFKFWAAGHPRVSKPLDNCMPCYYCGVPADTVDHVPPRSVRVRLAELNLQNRYAHHEVPCCFECNSLLGARAPFGLTDRKRYLKTRLSRRYAKLLRIPKWDDAELAEVGHSLQSYVLHGVIASELARARLAW